MPQCGFSSYCRRLPGDRSERAHPHGCRNSCLGIATMVAVLGGAPSRPGTPRLADLARPRDGWQRSGGHWPLPIWVGEDTTSATLRVPRCRGERSGLSTPRGRGPRFRRCRTRQPLSDVARPNSIGRAGPRCWPSQRWNATRRTVRPWVHVNCGWSPTKVKYWARRSSDCWPSVRRTHCVAIS